MSPSIDVVIPVYGHHELTRACLEHLACQTVEHRVILVDDGSPELIRREWPGVTLIELGSNHGYTHAVNRGVREGGGEYVVLLNNDALLRPDCLERLVAPLQREPRVGSVAALMLTPGERAIDSFGVTADPTLAGFARLQGHPPQAALLAGPTPAIDPALAGRRGGQGPAASLAPGRGAGPAWALTGPEGTAGAYRRAAWEQVGGLDGTIRAYMEILDIALRLAGAGWEAAQAPDAIGVHLGSRTYGPRSPEQRRLAGFSRAYLLRRYGVLRGRAAARALLTEVLVVGADALLCRDLQAARGRLEGWRAAHGMPRRAWPPTRAIDPSITLRESLGLRRGAVGGRRSR